MLTSSRGMRKGRSDYKNLKPFKTRIVSNISTNVSGAGAGNVVNNAITMSSTNFPDFTDILGLFDEMRVIKGTLLHTYYVSVVGTQSSTGACCILFDPNLGSPSSVSQILTQSYHSKPYIQYASNSIVCNVGGRAFDSLKFKFPSALAPISSEDIPGQAWFALDGGTPPYICVVQSFQSTPGGSGEVTFQYFLELDVELRIRT